MSKDVLFLGGFCGTSTKSGRNYYCLNFAQTSELKDSFGFAVCQCFVDEKEYKEFMVKGKINSFVHATVKYIRGGWTLLDYSL